MSDPVQLMIDTYKNYPHVQDMKRVRVTFGTGKNKAICEGISYRFEKKYQPQERAVTEGPHQVGEIYHENRLEMIGPRPPIIKKGRQVFLYDTGNPKGGEWYLAYYYDGGELNQYHPWGSSFCVMEHVMVDYGHYADQRIDHYEDPKYKRVKMVVEFLEE